MDENITSDNGGLNNERISRKVVVLRRFVSSQYLQAAERRWDETGREKCSCCSRQDADGDETFELIGRVDVMADADAERADWRFTARCEKLEYILYVVGAI